MTAEPTLIPRGEFVREAGPLPPEFEEGPYRVRFARTPEDLDAALRLRFEVFNVELREGLDGSWATGRDLDRFDLHCDHLLVEHRGDGVLAGTYRMQTAEMAARGEGFYSDDEFDLSTLGKDVAGSAIEVGRACVLRPYRNRRVLYLLWRGLAAYLQHRGKRALFGCSSITSQDPAVGLAALRLLEREERVHPSVRVLPRPGYVCEASAEALAAVPPVSLPILFRTYLRYGAWVCGPPALDREFKTIDFLTYLDTAELPRDLRALFFDSDETETGRR